MPRIILSSIAAFVGTNIDDILVLTILFSTASTRRQRVRIAMGYAIGVLLLTLISAFTASGLQLLPEQWLRLLGLIPILTGVRACFAHDSEPASARSDLSSAILITLGNGADNLGVYVALFAQSQFNAVLLSAAVFLLMAVLWSFLAGRIAGLPALRRLIAHRALVPAALILLGLCILII